jgi:atypical dual specificity phosphatase
MSRRRRLKAHLLLYPTWAWNALNAFVLKRRNWWDWVDDRILLGARPSRGMAHELSRLGITGVVNTCEEYKGPVQAYQQLQIEQFWMPTIDFTHPKIEDVRNAVAFMDQLLQNQGKVYVHCKAGRGRSATVVLCWLMKHKGMTPETGQALLLEKRKHVNAQLTERPVVQQFYREDCLGNGTAN